VWVAECGVGWGGVGWGEAGWDGVSGEGGVWLGECLGPYEIPADPHPAWVVWWL